jgi:prolyl-tRNA synthetase
VVQHFKENIGFAWAPWCGDAECEARVKAETGGVTSRSLPEGEAASGACLACGKPARHRALWARAY